MTEPMTKKAPTQMRPGTRLIATGLVILAIGLLLIVIGYSTTNVTVMPGTFRTVETAGAPTPAAWLILLIGVILSAIGFGKRLLASVEK